MKLRIGIVGLRFGASIARSLRLGPGAEHFDVVAVCDRDAARAAAVAGETDATPYTSVEGMLEDPSVQVVGIFTPPTGRAALVEQVIRSGRDVMTTKPFERDPARASAVLDLAGRLGRVVHLNSPAPVMPPDLRQIERWREQHDLGRAVAARGETWASYDEEPDGSWYDSPEACPSAPLFRLGIYLINDLVHLLGDAEAVTVLDTRVRTMRPTADNGVLGIRFRSGALGTVFASFCIDDGSSYRDSLVVSYERGSIYRSHAPMGRGDGTTELTLARPGDEGGSILDTACVEGRSGDYDWSAFRTAVDDRMIVSPASARGIVAGVRIVDAMWRAGPTGAAPVHT